MSCVNLISGQNSACKSYAKKYYQQLVLINKKDVDSFLIFTPATNIDGGYNCRYRIAFKLKEGKSGIRFTASENANVITGAFLKSDKENIPRYRHVVNLPIFGVEEDTKCILEQLDNSDYFAVLQYYDNTVEVFGWEFGLETNDYEYNPSENSGGGVIQLSSEDDALEDLMPLVYFSSGNEVEDFDNNFSDVPELPSGDFNNDFNDDFYNG